MDKYQSVLMPELPGGVQWTGDLSRELNDEGDKVRRGEHHKSRQTPLCSTLTLVSVGKLVAVVAVLLHCVVGTQSLEISWARVVRGDQPVPLHNLGTGQTLKATKKRLQDCGFLTTRGIHKEHLYVTVDFEKGDTIVLPCHYCGAYPLEPMVWTRTEFNWDDTWVVSAKLRELFGTNLSRSVFPQKKGGKKGKKRSSYFSGPQERTTRGYRRHGRKNSKSTLWKQPQYKREEKYLRQLRLKITEKAFAQLVKEFSIPTYYYNPELGMKALRFFGWRSFINGDWSLYSDVIEINEMNVFIQSLLERDHDTAKVIAKHMFRDEVRKYALADLELYSVFDSVIDGKYDQAVILLGRRFNVTEMIEYFVRQNQHQAWQYMADRRQVRAEKMSIFTPYINKQVKKRFVQRTDDSLVIYNAREEDSDCYSCSAGKVNDIQKGSVTQCINYIEPRGYYHQQLGGMLEFQQYKKAVETNYSSVLQFYEDADNGFLADTKFRLKLGKLGKCEACGGATGWALQDTQLRIYKPFMKSVVKSKYGKRKKLFEFVWGKDKQKKRPTDNSQGAFEEGLHVRSSVLRKMAPTFVKNAQYEITEFQILRACQSDRPCKEGSMKKYTLAPKQIHRVLLGDSVVLRCPAADSTEAVTWFRNTTPVLSAPGIFLGNATLTITAIKPEHAGMYHCFVTVKQNTTVLERRGSVYVHLLDEVFLVDFIRNFPKFHPLMFLVAIFGIMGLVLLYPVYLEYKKQRRIHLELKALQEQKGEGKRQFKPQHTYQQELKRRRMQQLVAALDSRNVRQMIKLEKQLADTVYELDDDEVEMLVFLSSEIASTHQSNGFLTPGDHHSVNNVSCG